VEDVIHLLESAGFRQAADFARGGQVQGFPQIIASTGSDRSDFDFAHQDGWKRNFF
jgi:hypothetical protein